MRKSLYVVYDKTTMKIIKFFDWYMKAQDFTDQHENYECFNRSHPTRKKLFKQLTKNQ